MIELAARGAWRELEGKLRPFISRRLRSEVDVDDVVQEVFLRMQRGLDGLRDDQRFGPWVYQVARSAIADHFRAAAKHGVVNAQGIEDRLIENQDDLDRSLEQELARSLAPFVAILASPYREAITLVELEGQKQKEAAEILGISLSGMKSRVQRGRVLLRKLLEDCCTIALDTRGRMMSCERRPDGRVPDGCCSESEGARGPVRQGCSAGTHGESVPGVSSRRP